MTHTSAIQPTITRRGSHPAPARRSRAVLLGLLAGLLPLAAWAQFDQYTAPGGPAGRPEDRKGALENASAEARWRLGQLRVEPWIGLKDLEYVDNAFGAPGGKTGDYTATVGAGLRAYLHSGPKLIWAAHALPEYVWWKDLSERRRVNGRYGIGAFGFWNHLNLEATATRDQEQRVTTPELPEPVHSRTDRAHLSLDAPIGGRLSVFGSGEKGQFRSLVRGTSGSDPAESSLALLDRDETIWRAGLRYNLPRRWSVGLGGERSQVDFVNPAVRLSAFADRSNSGTSPLLQIRHDSKEVFLSLEAVRRSLSPSGGSSFVPFKSTTVDGQAGFNTARRLSYW
ncbi:MAG TPA: hypothetical protein VOA87_03110, partial [Thermoanaerobaculia bacterium]|nr:hypothetical protein [Thermoanaerobaculia bacterium]